MSMVFLIFFFVFLIIFFTFLMFSIAFLTLHERQILSLSHLRKSPEKVSFLGIFQAFFDGLKLFSKEILFSFFSNSFMFVIMPSLMFCIMFMNWLVLPFFFYFLNFEMSFLFFLSLVGMLVYSLLMMGIFSKSKYSMLGSVRAGCQSVSFEVIFFFLLFSLMVILQSFKMSENLNILGFVMYPVFFLTMLVELNRPPFDFSEGESELVSGYNLEFGSVLFVLQFLSEYGFLLFFSIMSSILFFWSFFIFFYITFTILLLIRSVLPRYRYDLMMMMFWHLFLPFCMVWFCFIFLLFVSF